MRNLQEVLAAEDGLAESLEGWSLESGQAVNSDGSVIVGFGQEPEGNREAFRVDLRGDILIGDYNNNGLVEQADLDLVLLLWGADAASIPPTRINDLPDGPIDQEELDKVLLGWGNTASVAAATSAVPEPDTALLLIVVLAAATAGQARIKRPAP